MELTRSGFELLRELLRGPERSSPVLNSSVPSGAGKAKAPSPKTPTNVAWRSTSGTFAASSVTIRGRPRWLQTVRGAG